MSFTELYFSCYCGVQLPRKQIIVTADDTNEIWDTTTGLVMTLMMCDIKLLDLELNTNESNECEDPKFNRVIKTCVKKKPTNKSSDTKDMK